MAGQRARPGGLKLGLPGLSTIISPGLHHSHHKGPSTRLILTRCMTVLHGQAQQVTLAAYTSVFQGQKQTVPLLLQWSKFVTKLE